MTWNHKLTQKWNRYNSTEIDGENNVLPVKPNYDNVLNNSLSEFKENLRKIAESQGDYDLNRAKEAEVRGKQMYDPKTKHWFSVDEATPEETKLYTLPERSYYSLKSQNHPTLHKSINAEATAKNGPRRPVQNPLNGKIFFIPESAPTPHGMVDFSLKKPRR
jgi:hypothetical protein